MKKRIIQTILRGADSYKKWKRRKLYENKHFAPVTHILKNSSYEFLKDRFILHKLKRRKNNEGSFWNVSSKESGYFL